MYLLRLACVNLLKRARTVLGNVLLMVITLSVLYFCCSLMYSMNCFMDTTINTSTKYRSIMALDLKNRTSDEIYSQLNSVDHIAYLYPQVGDIGVLSKIDNSNEVFWVTYMPTITQLQPEIIKGRKFSEDDLKVALIPEDFVLEGEEEGNTKKFSSNALIGKYLEFELYGKLIKLEVIGTYDAQSSGNSSNTVYIPNDYMFSINKDDSYLEDTVDQKSYTVVVDSYKYLEQIEKDLNEKYSFSAERFSNIERFVTFKNFFEIIAVLVIAVLLLFALLNIITTVYKSIKIRTPEIGLYKAIGYNNGQILSITLIEMLIISILSLLIVFVLIFFVHFFIGNNETVLEMFSPLKLDFSFLAVALTTAVGVIVPILGSLFSFSKIKKIQPTVALREE